MQLTLVEKREETPDVKTFFFESAQPLSWKAGQYIHYKLPHPNPDERGIERYFSISSAAFEGRVGLTTRFAEKSSSFKKALNNLPIGGKIEADPPEGDFILDRVTKPVVFISGGIGITPFRAMLLDLEKRNESLDVLLLWANRSDDIPFRAEIDALSRRKPKFRIQYFIGDRRLDEKPVRAAVPDLHAHKFYVSGPEPMVESFDKILKQIGVPESEVVNDFFPGYEWP